MSRPRCDHCLRPPAYCYCHRLIQVDNRYPITIVQHPSEAKHAIGTARIAQLQLTRCTLLLNNHEHATQLDELLDQDPVLVYPSDHTQPYQQLKSEPLSHLIFLDGTWRKTKRMLHENPRLRALRRISLNPTAPSNYRIRKEPSGRSLSTIEAIAQLLGELEHDHPKYQPLLATMNWIIDQQIAAMGSDTYHQNYSS